MFVYVFVCCCRILWYGIKHAHILKLEYVAGGNMTSKTGNNEQPESQTFNWPQRFHFPLHVEFPLASRRRGDVTFREGDRYKETPMAHPLQSTFLSPES